MTRHGDIPHTQYHNDISGDVRFDKDKIVMYWLSHHIVPHHDIVIIRVAGQRIDKIHCSIHYIRSYHGLHSVTIMLLIVF